MKRILLALLFIPALCHAQVAEISVKGGVVTNKMMRSILPSRVTNPVGYSGGVALTFGLPAGFRLGVAASVYDLKAEVYANETDDWGRFTGRKVTNNMSFGEPLIPVEALLIKRFNAGRIRIDIGASAGLLFNKKISTNSEDHMHLNKVYVDKANTWTTYGGLIGLQYRLGCRTAIGVEAQPKALKIFTYDPALAVPVMLKFSYSL